MSDRATLYWGETRTAELEPVSHEEELVAVREASIQLYSGLTPGGYSYMPRLDVYRDHRGATEEDVTCNPLLFGPTWQLGFRIGAIPLKTFRLQPNPSGGHQVPQESPEHPAAKLLRSPNPITTRPHLIAGTIATVLMHRKCGWYKERGGDGKPVELYPIPGHLLKPVRHPTKLLAGFELKRGLGKPIPLKAEDVCYFRFMPDPRNWIDGWSPLQVLGNPAGVGQSAGNAMQEAFNSGILQRVYLALKEAVDDEGNFARLEAQVEKAQGRGMGVPIIEGGELKNMGDGPNDQLLIGGTAWALKLIEWVLGLDGDRQAFYSDVVAPIAEVITEELNRSLMSEWPSDPAYAEFMYHSILIGSPKEQAEYWRTEILSGQASPQEARLAQDRPVMPGDDVLLIPLNMVALGVPPEQQPALPEPSAKKGSSDGLGGNEGKDTTPSAVTAASRVNGMLRAARAERWGELRGRLLDGRVSALERRIRGVLKKETTDVRRAAGLDGRLRDSVGMPDLAELILIVQDSEPELAKRLKAGMVAAGTDAWGEAQDFLDFERTEMADTVEQLIGDRAEYVASRFGQFRADRLRQTMNRWLAGDEDLRTLAEVISSWSSSVSDYYVDGIARSESAFAFERAATSSWAFAGVRQFDVVFGGGPCSTSICEEVADGSPYGLGDELDNVGASFSGAEAPPLHANCTCFSVASA